MNKKNLILFYNTMWGQPLSYPDDDIPEGFMLTTDRRFLQEAVALIFYLPSLRLNESFVKKKQGQIWVAWSMECCEAHYPQLCEPSFMKFFDLQMNYHLNADVVVPYIRYNFRELLREKTQEKEREKIINSFISSSFNQSGRAEYLRELMNHLDVHSYGKLFQNRVIQHDKGYQSKMELIAKYQLTLSCENAIVQDYVTEKFYDPLIAGSVPVYLGAPNINDFAPGDRCFINASDFNSPASLAEYLLAVSKDEALYQSYFEWKTKPFSPTFAKMLDQQKEHPFVRLCKRIQEMVERC